ncbi:MAG TPA: hypothetical protein DC049_02730 [Spirochaetia bacterium]|nr:hypothetical protein [Spirochaetia bacterium]
MNKKMREALKMVTDQLAGKIKITTDIENDKFKIIARPAQNELQDREEELKKYEEKNKLRVENISSGKVKILMALHVIEKKGLYKIKGFNSIKEYIVKLQITERINMHISSIYDKLNIITYAEKYQLDYEKDVLQIGEKKFRLLLRGKLELGKDITLEELKSKKYSDLKKMVFLKKESNTSTTFTHTTQAENNEKLFIQLTMNAQEVILDKGLNQISMKFESDDYRNYARIIKNLKSEKLRGIKKR